jgi:hypothetical protein
MSRDGNNDDHLHQAKNNHSVLTTVTMVTWIRYTYHCHSIHHHHPQHLSAPSVLLRFNFHMVGNHHYYPRLHLFLALTLIGRGRIGTPCNSRRLCSGRHGGVATGCKCGNISPSGLRAFSSTGPACPGCTHPGTATSAARRSSEHPTPPPRGLHPPQVLSVPQVTRLRK